MLYGWYHASAQKGRDAKGWKECSHLQECIATQNMDIESQFWLRTRVTGAGEQKFRCSLPWSSWVKGLRCGLGETPVSSTYWPTLLESHSWKILSHIICCRTFSSVTVWCTENGEVGWSPILTQGVPIPTHLIEAQKEPLNSTGDLMGELAPVLSVYDW